MEAVRIKVGSGVNNQTIVVGLKLTLDAEVASLYGIVECIENGNPMPKILYRQRFLSVVSFWSHRHSCTTRPTPQTDALRLRLSNPMILYPLPLSGIVSPSIQAYQQFTLVLHQAQY